MLLKNNKYLSYLFLIVLIVLPGCKPNKNYLKRFPQIMSEHTIRENKNNVSLTLTPMNRQESEKYFGVNLIQKGTFPFHLHLENHSNTPYIIEPSYITVDLTSPYRIAKMLHYDTQNHVTYSSTFALLFAWTLIPYVIIPTGYSMYKTNKKITKNIRRNSIGPRDTVKIPPYGNVDKFFFIDEADFQSRFVIKLCAQEKDHQLIRYLINLD